jgi:predicted DNA-binding transcriptional regulator YafY
MTDASERIVNLAIHLAAAKRPVSAEEVRANVAGYAGDQDDAAFGRMFERDKEQLRHAGLVLTVDRAEGSERYRLDAAATYAGPVELDPREAMELRVAGSAMLADPSFPYPDDLRFALAKLMARSSALDMSAAPVASALTADEDPLEQGRMVARLTAAVGARKRVTFEYTAVDGARSSRDTEPWGLFARDGRWYLVARDLAADAARVFAVSRMRETTVNEARPKAADFERPKDFDVRDFMVMPFQYGSARTEALLRFTGDAARRAQALAQGQGALAPLADGSVEWRIGIADPRRLAQWVADAGPGIRIVEPASARELLRAGLRDVEAAHG